MKTNKFPSSVDAFQPLTFKSRADRSHQLVVRRWCGRALSTVVALFRRFSDENLLFYGRKSADEFYYCIRKKTRTVDAIESNEVSAELI